MEIDLDKGKYKKSAGIHINIDQHKPESEANNMSLKNAAQMN